MHGTDMSFIPGSLLASHSSTLCHNFPQLFQPNSGISIFYHVLSHIYILIYSVWNGHVSWKSQYIKNVFQAKTQSLLKLSIQEKIICSTLFPSHVLPFKCWPSVRQEQRTVDVRWWTWTDAQQPLYYELYPQILEDVLAFPFLSTFTLFIHSLNQ